MFLLLLITFGEKYTNVYDTKDKKQNVILRDYINNREKNINN